MSQVEEEREQAIFWRRRHLTTASLSVFNPCNLFTIRARKRAVLTYYSSEWSQTPPQAPPRPGSQAAVALSQADLMREQYLELATYAASPTR